jgi:L-amino acid N-acyltransferase YncA
VALEGKKVIGWASMSQWSDRCAYAATAEASLYVREGYQGKGVGRQLSIAILKAAKGAGLHTAILRIAGDNTISIKLAESLGFKHIGVMKEVGHKFGKLLDVYLMQIIFD